MKTQRDKMYLIQAFRGIAALLILLHHGESILIDNGVGIISNILKAAWVGVDFFFVLSGFIIFYIHFNDFGRRDRVKGSFSRFMRVFPIYWIVTFLVVILYTLVLREGQSYTLSFILKSIFLFPQAGNPIVVVGWSLTFEIFFYILFSLLIILKPIYSKLLISGWVLGVFLNSFGIFDFSEHFYLNFMFSNYNIEFITGGLVAYITLKTKIRNPVTIFVTGLATFITGWILIINGQLERETTASMLLFSLACGLLILAAATFDLTKKPLVPGTLKLIGDASYSIYLTHVYVFMVLNKVMIALGASNSIIILLISSLIALIAGVVFHLVIEKNVLLFFNNKMLKRFLLRIHKRN